MKHKKTIVIASTVLIISGILYMAVSKKKSQPIDYASDQDFMNLIKKIDQAKK